jgi:ribosome biogenesis GTPase A
VIDDSGLAKGKGEDAGGISELALPNLLALAIHSILNPSPNQARLLELLSHLQGRLATERFQLAVLGQFKRGKSTLLNALLRANVLPVGVIPVTAIPTFLEAAVTPAFSVTYSNKNVKEFKVDGSESLRERLAEFVTEERNSGNRLGIARIDVQVPSPLLERGVVLIDTPGVGSTLRHNSAAADAVLPECDAALFVLSADPPITEAELEFLARIRQTAARIIIVVNKIDLLETAECDQAVAFLRRVLTEQGKLEEDTPIFRLSARKALRAAKTDDSDELEASGIAALETHLTTFLATEKKATLEAAVGCKASAVVGALRLETEITLRALRLPIDDLEQRIAAFDQATEQFETERRVARDLLAGDRRRSIRELEAAAERLRNEARMVLGQVVEQSLAKNENPQSARKILTPIILSFFDEARDNMMQRVGERLTAVLRVHQQRADALILLVRKTAADLLEIPFQAPPAEEAFACRRDPFWITGPNPVALNPIPPDTLDRFFPTSVRRKRVCNRVLREIEVVLVRNVENLRWATLQNLEDAFRRFGFELDERLATSLAATRGAMKAALNRRTQQSEAIETAIIEEEATVAKLLSIERRLRSRAISSL